MDDGTELTNGRTALHVAARKNDPLCTGMLLEAGSQVEAKDNDGATAIKLAADHNYCGPVRILLEKNAKFGTFTRRLKNNIAQCKHGKK